MSATRLVVFSLVILSLSTLLHAQVASRWISLLRPSGSVLWGVRIAFSILFLTIPASFVLVRTGRTGWAAEIVSLVGYLWMGALFLLWVGTISGTVSGWILRGIARWGGWDAGPWVHSVHWGFQILALAGVVAAVVGGRSSPRIQEVQVSVPGLPRSFDGYRIAHVSDTHFSHLRGRRHAQHLVDALDRADADLVVHTGDLADGTVEALRDAVAPLAEIRSRDGKLFVRGNHEAYSGIASWTAEVRRLGWDVLVNEHRVLARGEDSLHVAGITDSHEAGAPGGVAPDPAKALEGVPRGAAVILLAHQPRQALAARGMGVGLMLSGHTHGGQIWPFHHLVPLQQPMLAGLGRLADVQTFVSRGAGTWGPPLRLFARSEIPVLVLRSL
ncbi:MAG TPA: metallophosphoesterase [Fibrobacteria bacterium]|nr:metallophosphoesterase [Fibrobacteria bacterium]